MRTGDKQDSSNTSGSSWRSHGDRDCPFQPAQASPAQVNHGSSSPHPHARPGKKRSLAAPSLQSPPTDSHHGPSSAFPLPGQAKPPHCSPYTARQPLMDVRRGAKQGTIFGSGLTSTTKGKTHWSRSCSCSLAWATPCQHRRALQLAQAPCPAGWPRPFLQASSSPRQGAGASQPQLSCSPSLQESRPCSSPTTTSPFSATANCDSEEESLSEVFLLCQLSNAQEEPLAAPHQELDIGLFYNSCLKVTCINFVQFKAFCPGLCIQPYSPYSLALDLTINRRQI